MSNWSGLWDRQYGTPYSALGQNTKEFNSTEQRHITKALRSRGGKVLGAVIAALTGAAVGGTATSTAKQIAGDPDLLNTYTGGGLRTINTVTDISRVTTSADETLVDALTSGTFAPTTYPTDAAGNGGGGKVGKF